ncbi:MAG TPA: ABC transporter substrate-binding protein [Stellaceae bacterium]|nr:ABC transporter substrate-binding protein [Stellaceae bacterium]
MAISRRAALAALGFVPALLRAADAMAADPLPLVRVSIVPIFAVAPHFAADKLGYFAAEGIAVTAQPVQSGTIGIPGLIGGSFDVLYSNSISVMTALERGIDLRIIASGTPIPEKPPDPGALMQRKGAGLHSGKDLEGKIIGINARFDIQWLVAQGWVKQTGGDPGKVIYREVPLPSMLDALAAGQVDAALVLDPFMTVGLGDPRFERLDWALSTVMPGLPSSLWVVSGKVADAKTDLIRAYVRGFLKGAEWVDAHLGDAAYLQLVAGFTRTDEKLLARMTVGKQPAQIDAAALKRLVVLMKEYDLLKTDVDVDAKIFRS